MPHIVSTMALTVALLSLAGPAAAYGTFSCVAPDGNEICVLDTGTKTDISPTAMCNSSCPACAGRCDAARRYQPQTGRWAKSWQGTSGFSGNNSMIPGANPQGDARTILQDGLLGPGTPPSPPMENTRSKP